MAPSQQRRDRTVHKRRRDEAHFRSKAVKLSALHRRRVLITDRSDATRCYTSRGIVSRRSDSIWCFFTPMPRAGRWPRYRQGSSRFRSPRKCACQLGSAPSYAFAPIECLHDLTPLEHGGTRDAHADAVSRRPRLVGPGLERETGSHRPAIRRRTRFCNQRE